MMKSGIRFEQGEIVLMPFPFTDLTSVRKRPVLVLSNNKYNDDTEDFIVCGITSNLKNADCSVLVDNSRLAMGHLPVKSRIKVDKIFTLKQNLANKKIGKINEETFRQVRRELIRLI